MAYHEHPEFEAYSQHDETIFLIRVVRVKKADGTLVQEHGLGLFKRDTVLAFVFTILILIPFELNATYVLTVYVSYLVLVPQRPPLAQTPAL